LLPYTIAISTNRATRRNKLKKLETYTNQNFGVEVQEVFEGIGIVTNTVGFNEVNEVVDFVENMKHSDSVLQITLKCDHEERIVFVG
tara:strand:+ start:618 stop:878 length:261 start_codon:yes stop_codon:yes gene_type:complete